MSKHLLLSLLVFSTQLCAQTALLLAPPTAKRSPSGIVTLETTTPDTTILYTLDGADPIAKSNP
jgi:hypothetical protein